MVNLQWSINVVYLRIYNIFFNYSINNKAALQVFLRPRIKISAFLFADLIFCVSFFYQEKKKIESMLNEKSSSFVATSLKTI